MLQKIENWFFKYRLMVLASFVLLTVIMGYFAVQIRMDAGFYKQLPNSHSFVKTYYEYQDDLSGTNSITVALRTTEGDIFNKEYFSKFDLLNGNPFLTSSVLYRTVIIKNFLNKLRRGFTRKRKLENQDELMQTNMTPDEGNLPTTIT